MMPPARWPGPGRHPLVLLQQAAVNLGADAADSFYVANTTGVPIDADQRQRVDKALLAAALGVPADVT